MVLRFHLLVHFHEVLKLLKEVKLLRLIAFLIILAVRWELETLIPRLLLHLFRKGGYHVLDIHWVSTVLSALRVTTHPRHHIVEEFYYSALVKSLV